MSYLVLARKYRPTTFEQVVGQRHITKTIMNSLVNNRLAHAFCFAGPRGVGKTSVARILAKAVNCVRYPTSPNPCGVCICCREIDQGQAVDVQEIDAASSSRVDDVREIREIMRYRPQNSRYRVTIFDEVHMLSKAAFNALLKILEEPPNYTIFILATTDVYKVPLTILSRCQRYDFRRLSHKLLVEHLKNVSRKEGFTLVLESLLLIAKEADGSVRDALSLLDQIISFGKDQISHKEVIELLGLINYKLVTSTTKAMLAGDAVKLLELVNQVYIAGGEMQIFCTALQEHFRNLIIAKIISSETAFFGFTKEEITQLKLQANEITIETLYEFFDQLVNLEKLFYRSNYPRLVMEITLLKLTQIRPVFSLSDIIIRLNHAIKMFSNQLVKRNYFDIFSGSNLLSINRYKINSFLHNGFILSQNCLLTNEEILRKLAFYITKIDPTLAFYLRRSTLIQNKKEWFIMLPISSLAIEVANQKNEAKLKALAIELWQNIPSLHLIVSTLIKPIYMVEQQNMSLVSNLVEYYILYRAIRIFRTHFFNI